MYECHPLVIQEVDLIAVTTYAVWWYLLIVPPQDLSHYRMVDGEGGVTNSGVVINS